LSHHFTLCHNRLLEYFFCFLFVDSTVCNPNIYSSSTEGPNNKLFLLSPSIINGHLLICDWLIDNQSTQKSKVRQVAKDVVKSEVYPQIYSP